MPTQEQYNQSEVGEAETKRIEEHFTSSPFWKSILQSNVTIPRQLEGGRCQNQLGRLRVPGDAVGK